MSAIHVTTVKEKKHVSLQRVSKILFSSRLNEKHVEITATVYIYIEKNIMYQ